MKAGSVVRCPLSFVLGPWPVVRGWWLRGTGPSAPSRRARGFAVRHLLAPREPDHGPGTKDKGQRTRDHLAFTLVELIAAMAIMLLLASVAVPLMRVRAERVREGELHRDLREMRGAIDRYKDLVDRGMIPATANTFNYPPDLDTLVKGVPLKGSSDVKYKFLRKIPVDPMTGKADWGMRSMQDDPDSKTWGGEDVFDVYSLSQGTALDGSKYGDW